jgi:hypothetical protein
MTQDTMRAWAAAGRRWTNRIGVAAALLALTQAAAAPAAAQIVKPPKTPPPAGEYQNITVILPASWDTRSVTFETRGLSEDTFLHRAYPFQFNCPADSVCYIGSLRTDIRNRGLYDIEFVATDGQGRTRIVRGEFEIGKPEDHDGDGMPNMWEQTYGLGPANGGPGDDPDGDGVPNIEEYRRGTHPLGRYVQYFGESSSGDRQQMAPCVYWGITTIHAWPNAFRYRLIGDDGRQIVVAPGPGFTNCPMSPYYYVADRVVAIEVESETPIAVERTLERPVPNIYADPNDVLYAQAATQPSPEWHFAQGSVSDPLGVFLLAYNPQDTAVEATYTFYGVRGESGRVVTRTLAPHARTTFWVDADEPGLAGKDGAVVVRASAPILMDRGLRWNPPGRTVPHDSSSAGASAASARWYFPHVDASRRSDERLIIGNPTEHPTTVEFTLVHGVRAPAASRVSVGPMSQVMVRTADFGRDATVGVIATSTTGVPVVVELAQRGVTASGVHWAYSTPGTTKAATEWALPQIRQGLGGDGLERGLVLMNPSGLDAEVEVLSEVEKDDVSTRPVRYLVHVPAGRFKVMPVANVEPSSTNPDLSETLSFRIENATIRSLPGPDGRPAVPIVAARTSLVTAGGTPGARREHTILPRAQP